MSLIYTITDHQSDTRSQWAVSLVIAGSYFSRRRSKVFVHIYTNKIGDCLFIYLFVYLSICSAIGGQTARPKRLKFGG